MIQLDNSIHHTLKLSYEEAKGKWWGCNWQTKHGPRRLLLKDFRAKQARLMAEATSGEEAAAWDAAARYLVQVELDAKAAENAAADAIAFAMNESWGAALRSMDAAVRLESKYRISETWKPLRDVIASQASMEPSKPFER